MTSVAVLLALLFPQAGSALAASDVEDHYHSLETLNSDITRRGASPADYKQLRSLRDFFVAQGDPGAVLLVAKLQQMNEGELRFLGGREEFSERVTDYVVKYHNTILKYDVCMILADMFEGLSPQMQRSVLETISASFTPSTYGREDMQFLWVALERIGPNAVPYIIRLANHRSEQVRCRASSVLWDIAKACASGQPGQPETKLPPKLNCEVSTDQREAAIRTWERWWREEGKEYPFPKEPSLFDVVDSSGTE